MQCLCHHHFGSSLPGSEVRRLADSGSEEEGDLPRPESPDFAELCQALGEWAPEFPLPGGPRASPDLVEAILASVEAEGELEVEPATSSSVAATFEGDQGASVSGAGLKRLRFEDGDEVESPDPGPSSKIARPHSSTTAESTVLSQLVYLGDRGTKSVQAPPLLHPPAQSSSSPQTSKSTSVSQQSAITSGVPHAAGLTGAASFSEEKPSTSSSSALEPRARGTPQTAPLRKHPFVRLASLQFGVGSVEFAADAIRSATRVNPRYITTLREMRELFLEERLSETDAKRLIFLSLDLAEHTYHMQTTTVYEVRPSHAAGILGQRFMIFWSLFSASQVLQQNWPRQTWWKEVAARVPIEYPPGSAWRAHASPFHVQLCLDLCRALSDLKNGIPVSDEMTISIKHRLFCSKPSPYQFGNPSWAPWKEDGQSPR
ncbi:hypothetical protein Emed_005643 [Eimeria media]